LNPDSEILLVEAAQNGDLESFGELYRRYYSAMAALAYSTLCDKELADDAAQETFVAACSRIVNLKSKDKFGAWLAGICRNISHQMLRNLKKQPRTLKDESASASSPRDTNGDIQAVIEQALRDLEESERELIVLRYYDNLPYERIAEVLDISVQAVNGRLIRTKRKIAKYLKHNGLTGNDYEEF
jgi:RNA polymerase sigma-70 factor (ECF subfamily)